MTSVDAKGRVSKILRQRLTADLSGVPVIWGVILLGTALLIGAVAVFRTGGIEVSGWEQAAQVARWYAGTVGVLLIGRFLPLYVAQGYTRREFTAQVPVVVVAFALLFGLMWALGYLVEAVVYDAFGWSQTLVGTHMYDSATDFPFAFAEFTLTAGVWAAGGAMLGAAFYRNLMWGFALIPLALGLVGSLEIAAGTRYFGPVSGADVLPVIDEPSLGTTLVVTVGAIVVALGVMWALVRNVPIHPRET